MSNLNIQDAASLELIQRGLHDVIRSKELEERASSGPMRVKLGLDPTASRVHLGWAVVLRKLRHFQEAGHIAVLVVGDYTAQIGDPSGKSATRKRLSAEEVMRYSKRCLENVTPLLLQDNLEIRFNSEWLRELPFDKVLELMSNATVSQILERDDFSNRFRGGKPISLVEFIYPLLQAFDSVQLHADVELGGSDQLFNNLMGRSLQGAYGQRPQIVCTVPLLVGLDGKEKMSQSLGNDVAVDEEPNEMFGKLMSIPDNVIVDYCKLAAWMTTDEITNIEVGLANGEIPPVIAKRAMSRTVVDIYHGSGAGSLAETAFDRVHVHRTAPAEMETRGITSLLGNLPALSLAEVVARVFGVSKSGARRLIDSGGIRINGSQQFVDRELTRSELENATLQRGKRSFVLLTDD